MRKIAAIAILCVLGFLMTGQLGLNSARTLISVFSGLSSAAPTDLQLGESMEIQNMEFRAGSGGGMSLRKRSGYEQLGSPTTTPVNGIFTFAAPGYDKQLLASMWYNLFIYDEVTATWDHVGGDPRAARCSCWAGNDTVAVINGTGNFWKFGTEEYTTIKLNAASPGIGRIMGDTSIRLLANHGLTEEVACTVSGTGNFGGIGNIFTDRYTDRTSILYAETLHVFSPNERVRYWGEAGAVIASPTIMTGLGDWDTATMTVELTGAVGVAEDEWVWISRTKSDEHNIAAYGVAKTQNSQTIRVDSFFYNYLYDGDTASENFFIQLSPSQPGAATDTMWDTLFKYIVDDVAVDSEFVGTIAITTTLQTVRVPGAYYTGSPSCGEYPLFNYLYYQRYITTKHNQWIWRWRIKSTNDGGNNTPENYVLDSLDYLTCVAKNIIDNYNDNNTLDLGQFEEQFPVTIDTAADGTNYFIVTTFGTTDSDTLFYDSTDWVRMEDNKGTAVSCDIGAPFCVFPLPLFFHGADGDHDVDYMIYDRTAGCATGPFLRIGCGSSNLRIQDSLAIECWDNEFVGGPVIADGAGEAFNDSDSLVLLRQTLGTITAAAIPFQIDAWSFPICVEMFNRFWCTGDEDNPDLVKITVDDRPDLFVDPVAGDVDSFFVRSPQGLPNTALVAENGIVYVHKDDGIWITPISRESLDPTVLYASGSRVGAKSQQGVVTTPYGHFLIASNGVHHFDGSQSQLISQEISEFWDDSVTQSSLVHARISYDVVANKLRVSVSTATYNNVTFVYDLNTQQWSKSTYGMGWSATIPYPSSTPRVYFGEPSLGNPSRIYRLSDAATTDAGSPYEALWRGGWISPFGLGREGNFVDYFIENDRTVNDAIIFGVYVNGDDSLSYADTFSSAIVGWRTDARPIGATIVGERFSFEVRSSAADFELTGMRIGTREIGDIGWRED